MSQCYTDTHDVMEKSLCDNRIARSGKVGVCDVKVVEVYVVPCTVKVFGGLILVLHHFRYSKALTSSRNCIRTQRRTIQMSPEKGE
jgi:hypothetical protein